MYRTERLLPLPSLRLTAYVTKVFAMANSLVAVQSNVICDAVRFLILNAQQPDGVFREVGRVYSGGMLVRTQIFINITNYIPIYKYN